MSYAIIALALASLAGLVVTLAYGYILGGVLDVTAAAGVAEQAQVAVAFKRHFGFALASTLVALFAESMVFFYFIGTGLSIKKAVALYQLDPSYLKKVREFKQRTSGLAFFALMALIAAFVLGGGAATRAIPSLVHSIVAWAAVLLHGFSAFAATSAIRDNLGVLAELDAIVRGKAARGEVVVERTVV